VVVARAAVVVVVVASAAMAAAAVVVAAAGKAVRASLNAMKRPGLLRAFFSPKFLLLLLLLAPTPPALAATGGACADLARALASGTGPTLLASYPTAQPGPLDRAAFVYDNAVATIALVGCGRSDLAARIGDALALATVQDRFWHDGRVRNAYAAGPVAPDSSLQAQPLRLAGWWDRAQRRWLEDSYQAGTDTGNVAWVMLALLALDDARGADASARAATRPYLRAALRLGTWVATQRDGRGAGGFTGGARGHEPAPDAQRWKSTEHNVDLAAAFARLARASGDPHWSTLAHDAAGFVAAMWDAHCACFATGTVADGGTPNPLLALDAQIWPLLALPGGVSRYGAALATTQTRLRAGAGYSYSSAGGGPWIEGSAQVLLLFERLHRDGQTDALRALLEAAHDPGGGYYATSADTVPTGFMLESDPTQPRVYPHLLHLGAGAWAALAQQGFNPFTAARSLPP
jgi:hypothetical protein